MQLEELLTEWDKDSEINKSELGEENRRIPRLTAKYLRLLAMEKVFLRQIESRLRKLYVEKQEYYVDGPANMEEWEAKKKVWKTVPERGRTFLRTSVGQYLDADDDIDTLRLKKEISETKIAALDLIMKSIMGRGFLLNNIFKWDLYSAGEGKSQ